MKRQEILYVGVTPEEAMAVMQAAGARGGWRTAIGFWELPSGRWVCVDESDPGYEHAWQRWLSEIHTMAYLIPLVRPPAPPLERLDDLADVRMYLGCGIGVETYGTEPFRLRRSRFSYRIPDGYRFVEFKPDAELTVRAFSYIKDALKPYLTVRGSTLRRDLRAAEPHEMWTRTPMSPAFAALVDAGCEPESNRPNVTLTMYTTPPPKGVKVASILPH